MVGVADGVGRRDAVAAQRVAVGVEVQPADVVLGHAPLTAAARGLALPPAVPEDVAPGHVGAVQGVVDRRQQAVDRVLGAVDAVQAGVDHLLLVRAPVPVGVPAEEQVGRREDEHAVPGQGDRARQDQTVQEHRAPVHAAVPVLVGQGRDRADRLLLAGPVHVRHVAAHLDHPQAPVVVEGDGHRVVHERLRGDELDAEARRHPEALQGLPGREHGGRRDGQVRGQVPLLLSLTIPRLGRGDGGQRAQDHGAGPAAAGGTEARRSGSHSDGRRRRTDGGGAGADTGDASLAPFRGVVAKPCRGL